MLFAIIKRENRLKFHLMLHSFGCTKAHIFILKFIQLLQLLCTNQKNIANKIYSIELHLFMVRFLN